MEHWIDRLSEYLDGELAAGEVRALEAHLTACPTCASTLEQLRVVVAKARDLEALPPETDPWPAIDARLRPRPAGLWPRLAERFDRFGRRFSLTIPQLAAAGVALVMLSAGTMWLVLHRSPVRVAPAPATAPVVGAIPTEPASFDESRYDAAVAELQQVLNEHRAELDTATVRILEQNLALIDRATEEARRALRADPANSYLHGHLAEQMMRKVRLLQLATEVVTAHS
jgi:hypothetical protein